MSMYQRAAQFAPFACLTGHDSTLEQTAKQFQQNIIDMENPDNDIF